jgi:CDP-diacylglycerol--serine O-phosphatidyltransferase
MVGAVLRNLRYLPPNLATSASLLLGLVSIHLSTHGQFKLAAWCILWCVMLDKLDGTLARLLRAQSNFGVEFDSFADFCAFGLAPAVLLAEQLLGLPEFAAGASRAMVFVGAGFYVVMAAGRLARYNIQTAALGDRLFFGLPSTLSGGLIGSGYLALGRYLPGVPGAAPLIVLVPVVLFLNGALMVTRFPLPKLRLGRARWWRWFQIANIVAVYGCAALMFGSEYLFVLSLSYATIGAYYGRRVAKAMEAERRLCGAGEG